MKSRWDQHCSKGAILVFVEKDGDRYFDASSLKKAGAACRTILRERHGRYWQKGKIELPKQPSLPKEQAKTLDGRLGEIARCEWQNYETGCREAQAETDFAASVALTLKIKNDSTALDLVFRRERHEYEWVTFEYLSLPVEGI